MAKDYDVLTRFAKTLIDNNDGTFSLRVGGSVLDTRYLMLDQTIPQTVANGSPEFAGGLTIQANQRVYLDGA